MDELVHKSLIGDFLDVLNMPSPLKAGSDNVCISLFGATTNQQAVLSRYFGELGIAQAADFAASLDALMSASVRLIVLDFSELRSFCRNGAAVLVNFVAGAYGREKNVILFRPAPAVSETITAVGMQHLFTVLQDEEDLLIALPD